MLPLRMREWQRIFVNDSALANFSLADDPHARALAEKLTNENILEILELRRGLSIRSTSYVGRIQLGDLQITIQPKIKLNVMVTLLQYAYHLRDLQSPTETDLESGAFQDILIHQLITEAAELMARGLQRHYRRVDESLAIPKGRLDLQAIVRRGGIIEASIPTIHYPRLEDTLINQVLLGGLELAVGLTTDLLLRSRLRRLAVQLEMNITRIPSLDLAIMKRLRGFMSRQTTHYEPSIALIELLLFSKGITLEATSTRTLIPGFLFDMNRFFERLLSRFLNEHLPDYIVHDQYPLRDMMAYAPDHNPRGRQAPIPRPDFVITQGGQVKRMLDAKYRDLWETTLPSGMLYQLAIYALSQGWNGQSVILYPALDDLPIPQVINIRDVLSSSHKAQIILTPVNLTQLSQLLRGNSTVARRQRVEFAEHLVFGTRASSA